MMADKPWATIKIKSNTNFDKLAQDILDVKTKEIKIRCILCDKKKLKLLDKNGEPFQITKPITTESDRDYKYKKISPARKRFLKDFINKVIAGDILC